MNANREVTSNSNNCKDYVIQCIFSKLFSENFSSHSPTLIEILNSIINHSRDIFSSNEISKDKDSQELFIQILFQVFDIDPELSSKHIGTENLHKVQFHQISDFVINNTEKDLPNSQKLAGLLGNSKNHILATKANHYLQQNSFDGIKDPRKNIVDISKINYFENKNKNITFNNYLTTTMDVIEILIGINPQDISNSDQLVSLLRKTFQFGDSNENRAFIDINLRMLNWIVSDEDRASRWNPNIVGETISSLTPQFSWDFVSQGIKQSKIIISGESGFEFIIRAWITAAGITSNSNDSFPLGDMCEGWADPKSKVTFLKKLLEIPELRRVKMDRGTEILTPAVEESLFIVNHQLAENMVASVWNSLNLILSLTQLLDTSCREQAQKLLELGNTEEPALITIGLVSLKVSNPQQQSLIQHNVARFLQKKLPNHLLFFELFRIIDRNMLVSVLCHLYRRGSGFLRPSLDILATTNIHLDLLLHLRPEELAMLDFVLELAVLANRRGYVVFEMWFLAMLTELGSDIIHPVLEVIQNKLQKENARQRGETISLSEIWVYEEFEIMFGALTQVAGSANNTASLKALYMQFMTLAPELKLLSDNDSKITDEKVEKDAETLFLQLYRGDLSLEKMLDILAELRDSPQKHQRRTYAYAVQYPIDEYKFFANYPEKELVTTACLVGQLVQRHMYTPSAEAAVVELVKTALLSSASSKTFQFGIVAMQQFSSRIETWPSFCIVVSQIPHIQQKDPETAKIIKSIMNSHLLPQNKLDNGESDDNSLLFNDVGDQRSATDKFTAIHPSGVVLPSYLQIQVEPSEQVSDKVQFVLNNLSSTNIESKTLELKPILEPKHSSWISLVLVKRASQEPNYHDIYHQFVDLLDIQVLRQFLIRETLLAINKLLNSESTISSSRDRGILGNLGLWLGGMTLLRDKPLIRNHISLKALLIQGYEADRLVVVIPFVCKVLKQSSQSQIFRPPNPWLMRNVSILIELYTTAELKLNLKFEIEVLCRALGLDIKTITPSQIIRDHVHRIVDALSHDLDSTNLLEQHQSSRNANPIAIPPAIPTLTSSDLTIDIVGALVQHAQFSTCSSLFHAQPSLKKIFYALSEKLIVDVIPIHIARAVYVATSATKDTVQRDFCGDSNEERMHRAAQLMARGLAGALVVSLCRDQLKSKMYMGLFEWLLSESLPENLASQLATGLVAENLDLACAIAEKEAIERASIQIDQLFNESYQARKKMRERTGQPFYDIGTHSSLIYPNDCPDVLRIKLSNVPPALIRVYEDFTQIPHFPSQINSSPVLSGVSGASQMALSPTNGRQELLSGGKSLASLGVGGEMTSNSDTRGVLGAKPLQQYLDILYLLLVEVEKCILIAAPGASLSTLPQTHVLRTHAKDILIIISRLSNYEGPIVEVAQSLIQQLLRTETRLGLELYVLLLLRVCQSFPVIARQVSRWLTYADNNDRLNVPVVLSLLSEGLLNPTQYDAQLAKLIDSGHFKAISFAVQLVRKAVIEQSVPALPQDFSSTIEALYQLYLQITSHNGSNLSSGINSEQVVSLISDFKQYRNSSNEVFEDNAKNPSTGSLAEKEQTETIRRLLVGWALLNDKLDASSSDCHILITKTYKILSSTFKADSGSKLDGSKISNFFQLCMKVAIENYENLLIKGSTNVDENSGTANASQPLGAGQSSSANISSGMTGGVQNFSSNSSTSKASEQHLKGYGPDSGSHGLLSAPGSTIGAESVSGNNQQPSSMDRDSKYDFSNNEDGSSSKSYQMLDGLAKMMIWMLRAPFWSVDLSAKDKEKSANLVNSMGDTKSDVNAIIYPLKCFLKTYTLMLVKDHFGAHFTTKQKPYFRLMSVLISELDKAFVDDPDGYQLSATAHLESLKMVGRSLLNVSPTFVSGFSFAWVSLIMHQKFLPYLLENRSTWRLVEALLAKQLESLEPFIGRGVVTESLCLLYRGTIRMILVILHDYPSFLADHAFALCNVVPLTCVQTHNLLLSAFPSGMVLPEPLMPNLKVDQLESSSVVPSVGSDYKPALRKAGILSKVDKFINDGEDSTIVNELIEKLLEFPSTASDLEVRILRLDGKFKFDVKVINFLVLHLIISAAGATFPDKSENIDYSDIPQSKRDNVNALILLLLDNMDFEGRFLLLASLANHLRYPSTHTSFVRELIFSLFLDQNRNSLEETLYVVARNINPISANPSPGIQANSSITPNPGLGANANNLIGMNVNSVSDGNQSMFSSMQGSLPNNASSSIPTN
ncbi:hypothetical protein BB559_002733 [Furculomyces boomerangus]|uniref:Uncharacterized protein n=1 Tax=Furculomyces boomerangus TaxID=61424 RepID=A0A2T9YSY3_9FUNG|nr:hypothetical protein BB559_002733 [Furculomyces boomerangus]